MGFLLSPRKIHLLTKLSSCQHPLRQVSSRDRGQAPSPIEGACPAGPSMIPHSLKVPKPPCWGGLTSYTRRKQPLGSPSFRNRSPHSHVHTFPCSFFCCCSLLLPCSRLIMVVEPNARIWCTLHEARKTKTKKVVESAHVRRSFVHCSGFIL